MKALLLTTTLAVFAVQKATAQDIFTSTAGGTVTLTEPVGSMISINVVANGPAVFRGTFSQSFNFNQSLQNPAGTTSFTRNFDFSGNANFNITSQFNQNVSSFTSSGWNFSW
jgi:hypothetical protein